MALPVGKTIKDRYRVIRVLSNQGGFGTTYLAYDLTRAQDVVIKESKTASDVEQEALLGELQILKTLDHPRLPKVFEGFFHERQLCVAMQYIHGRDVSSYLVMAGQDRRADPPDRPTALRWIVQTLEALAYLHSRGIVHRDIKPSNLRVHTETGDIFLLDFGISHHMDRSPIRAHSPRFSPPEQHDPTGAITPASDVYAVGATLYLLLTGHEPPYRDDHYDKTLRLPSEVSQTLPKELEDIVLKAMCYNAAERYPDAQSMLEEFQRLGYAPRLIPPQPESSVQAAIPAPSAAPKPATPGEAPVQRPLEVEDPYRTFATVTLPNLDDDAPPPSAAPAPSSSTDLPNNGIIQGRYNIRQIISKRGGFGVTYWATDIRRSGRDVLLKLSKTVDAETFNSLLAEYKLLSNLKHPHLPEVYESFSYQQGDRVLIGISMQYIRGRDVASYLQDGPPELPRTIQWVRQLLEVLAYLHKQDITHCDIKPSNLRIDRDTGNLFLLDFGISRQKDERAIRAFSPHYSAPEQRRRNGDVGHPADIYAVGAILYALLTGAPPPEINGQTDQLLFVHGDQLEIPNDLKEITQRALRFHASDRYPDAQAMLKAFNRLPYGKKAATSPLLWGAVGGSAVLLLVLAVVIGGLAWGRMNLTAAPTDVAAAVTPVAASAEATVAPLAEATVVAAAEPVTAPTPTLARTVIAASNVAVLIAPTTGITAPSPATIPTPAITATPRAYEVRQLEVIGQADSTAINVRQLPVRLALTGEGLDAITSVTLQPRLPGQRAIPLTLGRTQPDRVELELTALPSGFRVGEYELLVNDQVSRTLTLRDYIREARLQGVKPEYRYLAAIRPFPGISFNGQDVEGPFALLYQQPDESSRGSYLRNGDLIEILDDTTNPGLYLVRVRENFDPKVVGREGWIVAWIVGDTPPAPPAPGAIQMPYNIRGESREQVIAWLQQRGVPPEAILVDVQSRERIPDVFDSFQPDHVVSATPPEGAWIMPGSPVTLGVRAP